MQAEYGIPVYVWRVSSFRFDFIRSDFDILGLLRWEIINDDIEENK